MIVTWLVELFMSHMGEIRYNEPSTYLKNPRFIELQKQFESFLSINKVDVSFLFLIQYLYLATSYKFLQILGMHS